MSDIKRDLYRTGVEMSDKRIEAACAKADWVQVVLNGGPPCFHLEGDSFCFRAERWVGHENFHEFKSLLDFYKGATA